MSSLQTAHSMIGSPSPCCVSENSVYQLNTTQVEIICFPSSTDQAHAAVNRGAPVAVGLHSGPGLFIEPGAC